MKRIALLACMAASAGAAAGQVRTDGLLRFTGELAPGAITGLAPPEQGSAAVTISGALQSGSYTWCSSVTSIADTLVLAATPPLQDYRDGTLVRFIAPFALQGPRHLKAAGLAALPLVRADGLPLALGQVPAGYVVEAVQAGGRFVVLNTRGSGCPPGFTQAHENLCIETALTPGLLFRQGLQRCADLGGKLCAWDEYLAACTLLEGVLQNQFSEWEWIDDSSNHGHGADQAGRFTCASQRHYGPIPTFPAGTRCCFRPR